MKKNIISLALIVLGLTACSEKSVKTAPDGFKSGQQVYNKVCGACHGVDLMGNSAVPALMDDRFSPERFSDDQIRNTIINGSQSRVMRPQRGRVSDSEIEEIIKYIRYSQESKNTNQK